MQDVNKNTDGYNVDKERTVLIVFDDMIADMINNKKLNSVITELFARGRKLDICLVFITQSYFNVAKDVRLSSTHFLIMKIPNKRELQQIALNYSLGIDSKNFIKIYKRYTAEPCSFLVNDATINDALRFRKIFSIYIKIKTIDAKNRDEKLNTIFVEKRLKHQPYHLTNFASMNILLVNKYYHLIKNK